MIVDDVLILGDCLGDMYAWDISDLSGSPPLLWTMHLEGCIESTPAVWRGWLYFGTREGYLYGVADPPEAGTAGQSKRPGERVNPGPTADDLIRCGRPRSSTITADTATMPTAVPSGSPAHAREREGEAQDRDR